MKISSSHVSLTLSDLNCPRHTHHSEILYVVILSSPSMTALSVPNPMRTK